MTVVLWASAFVAIRSAGGHFAPGALALGRLLVASLALGVVWLFSGGGWPTRAAWPGILGSGLLWFGLYMVTLNWGERDVDAGTAAMLVNIGPILLALLGGWLLHEGFPRRLAAGMAVSFGGVLVVGISESDAHESTRKLQPSQLKRRPSSAPTASSTRWSGTCRQTLRPGAAHVTALCSQ